MRVYILALLGLVSCIEKPEVVIEEPSTQSVVTAPVPTQEEPQVIDSASNKLTLKVSKSEFGGYGFQIFQGENALIIQPHIPATQGTKGFVSEAQAAIIGDFMIHKITNGIMPPSVSIHDLDSLKIDY